MIETKLKGTRTEIIIGPGRPTVIIGSRINAAEESGLANAIRDANMTPIKQAARAEAEAGADIINVNVKVTGVDETKLLPMVVKAVAEAVPLPICIDTQEPEALAAALEVCPGRPLVNSITCSEWSLEELLPLAVRRGAAVIGTAMNDQGIPRTVEDRVELAREVLRRSITAGIARQDVILDPLALAVDDDPRAALTTLETISQLARIEAINLTLRPGRISNSLPHDQTIEDIFVALAIHHGVTCPIIDPSKGRKAVLITDVLFGCDDSMARYIDLAG